jgi:hypothetical protein
MLELRVESIPQHPQQVSCLKQTMTQINDSIELEKNAIAVIGGANPAKMHRSRRRDCRNGRARLNGFLPCPPQLDLSMHPKCKQPAE